MTTSSPPSDSRSSGFERLDPAVQRWVYDQGWTGLRRIQEEAIPVVLDGASDLVLSASTAAGKTEAVFLPLCSLLADAPRTSVRVLAISPLRALINDQARRLESLAEAVGTRVTPWHGDIGSGPKRRLIERPEGILLITPESFEAMFVLRGGEVRRVFADLGHVVVDELHSFAGSERGRQVQSLLQRLELVLRRRVPRLALSATLGADLEPTCEFLRPGGGPAVRRIVSREDGRELRLQLKGYLEGEEPPADVDALPAIADHLFRTLRGSDHLVFANRRAEVEQLADLLRRRSDDERVPNEFFPHHGSLSRDLRRDVERMLADPDRPVTAVCTSTLELGIDIGSVVSIGQVGAPFSATALRQRLGRSGRTPTDPSILRLYVSEDALTARTALQDRLRPALVQSIATVSLLLDGWCEPAENEALHLSTLVQQTLSLIAQHGGVRADDAWRALCRSGPFRAVGPDVFAELLRALAAHDLVVQMADGDLVLGRSGEILVDHFSFYVAFSTTAEYRIVAAGETLGTLPVAFPLSVGSYLIFGGRRWRVVGVDDGGSTVHVEPATGGTAPRFIGAGGLVHDAVRQRMLAVYRGGDVPAYLDRPARELLDEGRTAFREAGLDGTSIVTQSDEELVFLWAGDRALNTVLLHLRSEGIPASHDGLAIAARDAGAGELTAALRRLVDSPLDVVELAGLADGKVREKHHRYLTSSLLERDYASAMLDADGARRAVAQSLAGSSPS